jgi:hypothetical protein
MTGADASGDTDEPVDSLDLLEQVSGNIRELLATWDALAPDGRDPREAVSAARDRGTAGKELMEQAALRLAAIDDVSHLLRASGHGNIALLLDRNSPHARRLTSRLDEQSRGTSAIDLRYSQDFSDAIEQLRDVWADELDHQSEIVDQAGRALGPRRSDLHSPDFIRGHAPIHPSEHHHWYQDIPLVVRIHALYDRARSFPGLVLLSWVMTSPPRAAEGRCRPGPT